MTKFKTLFTAALLSTIAAAGFAQAPSSSNVGSLNPTAVVNAPSGRSAKPVAQKPKHQVKKHHAKKHVAKHPKSAKSVKKHHKASNANSMAPGKEAF